MTLTELTDHMWTRYTNVCEYTNLHLVTGNNKIVWIGSIVKDWKRCNGERANGTGW